MRRLYPVALLLAVAMGVALRLAWCEERDSRPPLRRGGWRSLVALEPANQDFPWLHDEYLYYVSTAANAFKGDGFLPDYNRVRDGVYVPPPLQSLFTLGVYRLHGRIVEPRVLQRWQVALAALMIVLCAEIGRRSGGLVAGVAAAWLVAIAPHFVYWVAFLQTEANYLVGLSVVLLLLVRWWQRPGAVGAASASLALGLLNLQRVNGLLLGPVFAAAALLRSGRRGAPSAAVFLLLPMLVLLPWLARNLLLYDQPILVNSNAGVHLYVANNIGLDAASTPYIDDALAQSSPFGPEIESWYRNQQGYLRRKFTYYRYSQRYLKLFGAYLREHPVHFLRNYAIKLWNEFALVQDAPRESIGLFELPGVFRVFDRALLFGGLVGLGVGLLRRRGEIIALTVPFALQALMGGLSILEKDGRYNVHLKLFLALFLAYGLAEAVSRASRKPGST